MSKPIVIAFSGGCFSGKTTTMEKLKESLEKRGHRVIMLSELVREYKIGSIDELRENPSKYLAFQDSIITSKISAEAHLLSQAYSDTDIVLVDRAITDSLFYLLFYVDKKELTERDLNIYWHLLSRAQNHAEYAFKHIYDEVIEFAPINKLCDDTVFRPQKIDILKYIESIAISMLNKHAMYSVRTSSSLTQWDLNRMSAEVLIQDIIERYEL